MDRNDHQWFQSLPGNFDLSTNMPAEPFHPQNLFQSLPGNFDLSTARLMAEGRGIIGFNPFQGILICRHGEITRRLIILDEFQSLPGNFDLSTCSRSSGLSTQEQFQSLPGNFDLSTGESDGSIALGNGFQSLPGNFDLSTIRRTRTPRPTSGTFQSLPGNFDLSTPFRISSDGGPCRVSIPSREF